MKYTLFFLLVAFVSTLSCYHACDTCTDLHYTHCLTCTDTQQSLISIPPTALGICTAPATTSLSGLGVFLLLLSIAAGLLLRSPHIFSFILSLQVLGLLSLVEVGYPKHLGTLLDAFQYLMVFSKMQQNGKTNDGVLIGRDMYRLEAFLTSVGLRLNITPVFVVTILVTILLGMLLLVRKYRQGKCMCLSNSALETLLTGLRTTLLLTMQQMLLLCYVGIRFGPFGASQVVILLLYCAIVVFLLVDLNYHRVPYFRSKKLLNLAIVQRLVLPVLAITPFTDTYNMVIFLNAFTLIELVFLAKSSAKPKYYVYAFLKLLCCLTIGAFVAVDLGLNNSRDSVIAGIVATCSLGVYLLAFLVEICLSLKELCLGGSKVQNKLSKVNREDLFVRANTNDKIAVMREDTIEEQRMGGALDQETHKQVSGMSGMSGMPSSQAPNLLGQLKKKERKYRVRKQ